ncbi:MAG: alpha/beta fold hydrolase, partial [Pseudomonadales bacterium]|nr:alpha/beta fold hydrolase [Pseudomonadales bacterium]
MTVVCDLDKIYDLDYKTTLIDLGAGGCMPVKIIKPQSYGPHPVVLLLMGMRGVGPSLCSMGRLIAEEGYAVAIPDLYHDTVGNADSMPHDFDEALEAMHGLREQKAMDDIAATLEFISSRRDLDDSRISLFGHCLGGRLSLVAANNFPNRFRCVTSYYASGIDACLAS